MKKRIDGDYIEDADYCDICGTPKLHANKPCSRCNLNKKIIYKIKDYAKYIKSIILRINIKVLFIIFLFAILGFEQHNLNKLKNRIESIEYDTSALSQKIEDNESKNNEFENEINDLKSKIEDLKIRISY